MKKTKMTEKGEVVLTDSSEEARTLQKSIPVIGICSPGSDKDWSGISFLADDWEDVDDEYAELAYCRYYHLPRVLVCGEWSVVSEQKLVIGGQNFEEQTHTWLIREADKKDAKAFETLYNDDEVKRFLPYPLEKQAQTCKDWEDWIESLHQYVYPSEEPSMWVLADENDDMIGRIGLEYKEKDEESGIPSGYYLGYAILPKWRKKGLAAKAASRLLKYCFEYWQLKEVYLLCSSENMASVKTALACGFTKMSSIEVPIQNSVFLQDIVEHCLNDCACVSTSLLFLFARKAL
jgi:RimJ/RimL family protein N-acetyltransferase